MCWKNRHHPRPSLSSSSSEKKKYKRDFDLIHSKSQRDVYTQRERKPFLIGSGGFSIIISFFSISPSNPLCVYIKKKWMKTCFLVATLLLPAALLPFPVELQFEVQGIFQFSKLPINYNHTLGFLGRGGGGSQVIEEEEEWRVYKICQQDRILFSPFSQTQVPFLYINFLFFISIQLFKDDLNPSVSCSGNGEAACLFSPFFIFHSGCSFLLQLSSITIKNIYTKKNQVSA